MNSYLRVVDDFLPTPLVAREEAVKSDIDFHAGPDGAKYRVSGFTPQGAIDGLSKVFGKPIKVHYSFCRLDLRGERPQTHCHSDRLCASHAALVYLNTDEQAHGGTAFFKHTKLGLHGMPAKQDKQLEATIDLDSTKAAAWDFAGFIGMKFNRLLVYPCSVFHSRYPHEAFGNGAENGRLVWVCFFDV